jgi:hypothetical protein
MKLKKEAARIWRTLFLTFNINFANERSNNYFLIMKLRKIGFLSATFAL